MKSLLLLLVVLLHLCHLSLNLRNFGIIHWHTYLTVLLPSSNKINLFPFLILKLLKNLCISYQLGKSHCLNFSFSNKCTSYFLELIHTDLWTSDTPSLSSICYYVFFLMDDFTYYTWIYFLKLKADTLSTF